MSSLETRFALSVSFFKLMSCFKISLAFSYIQCTDLILIIAFYDEDTGKADQYLEHL